MTKQRKFQCDNCGRTFTESKCKPARDLLERLDLGGEFTNLECPACGSLVYLLRPTASSLDMIEESLCTVEQQISRMRFAVHGLRPINRRGSK